MVPTERTVFWQKGMVSGQESDRAVGKTETGITPGNHFSKAKLKSYNWSYGETEISKILLSRRWKQIMDTMDVFTAF